MPGMKEILNTIEQGDFEKADLMLADSLISARLQDAKSLITAAHANWARGDLKSAELLYKTALAILEFTSSDRVHEQLVQTLTEYADLLHKLLRHEEADQLELRAKSLQQ